MNDDTSAVDEQHQIIDDTSAPLTEREKENDAEARELNISKDGKELSMQVKVYSPFKNYYDGTAFSVSAENLTGPFDILPKHHNFISLLSACELVIRTSKGEQKIQISGGIIHVKADQLIVFLDV